MIVYLDTSVVLKRVRAEDDSTDVLRLISRHAQAGDSLVTSALTWVETSRALHRIGVRERTELDSLTDRAVGDLVRVAIAAPVIDLAAHLSVQYMKTLDALHVASAMIVRADLVITRDEQMRNACEALSLAVA